MKTINFCGDSYCRSLEPSAWTYILADLLKHNILGGGDGGTAHEHAIQTFDDTADITVFCWTECDRIYHPEYRINYSSAENFRKTNKFYAAAYYYYYYVHDFDHSKTRQMRELYWFDHEVLSKYSGKVVHCWGFEKTYDFKHGVTFDTTLKSLSVINSDKGVNHFTPEQNYKLAYDLHKLIIEH